MKRIVVTGSNKGIGLAVVEALLAARDDVFVYLACRDAARGEAALASLVGGDEQRSGRAARAAVLPLDVTDPASVAAAAAALGDAPLYAVVNNAGVWGTPADTLATNLFGLAAVTDALAPRLQAGGRVVHVSSGVAPSFVSKCAPHRARALTTPAASPGEVLRAAREYLGALQAAPADGGAALAALGYPSADGDDPAASQAAYGASKAFVNALTLAQAAPLGAAGVAVNACSPGFIATDMTARFFTGKTPAEAGALPPAAATRVVTHLLFGDGVGAGRYYGSDAKRSPLDRYRAPGEPEYTGE